VAKGPVKRLLDIVEEYGQPIVDEVLSVLGKDADPAVVAKAVARRAKADAPTKVEAPAKVAKEKPPASLSAKSGKVPATPRAPKYQAVEPVVQRHPELQDVRFPQGAGLGGSFAVERGLPIVGRHPFMAQSNRGYSGLAGSVPANRVEVSSSPAFEMPPEVVQSPEQIAKEFRGGIPLIGDRIRGSTLIQGVNDRPQVGSTRTFAGPSFPRQQAAQGGTDVWRSNLSVIKAIDKQRQEAEQMLDGPIAGIYTTMGATGGDQSVSMIDLIGRQIAAGGIPQKQLDEMDNAIRLRLKRPDFIGFGVDPMAAAAQLNDIKTVKMPQRTAVTQMMDKASALSAGFPDIGANRVALTEPDLLYAPEGTSGKMISSLLPYKGYTADAGELAHPNYPSGLGGSYFGETETGIPRELMFSNYAKAMKDAPYTPVQKQAYLFGRTPVSIKKEYGSDPRIQQFDQEWVDSMSKYLEDIRKYGEEPYARGGLAVRRRQAPLAVRQSPRRRKSRKA
jgi:hypothetical protein